MSKPIPAVHYGNTAVKPEEAGFNTERLTRLDDHLIDLVVNEKLQCASYMLSRNGMVFAHRSVGSLTHREGSPDLKPDSIYSIASITKLFTAIAIMKLVEDGVLYLEQPVSSVIKEFDTDMHRKITIFHLLTHTSGIGADPGYFKEPYEAGWWDIWETQKQRGEESNWIKAILSGPALCKPGEKWNYFSAGFALLGEIVSRLSGIHCEQYIIDKICTPLGLKNTFFAVPEPLHPQVCYIDDWGESRLKRKSDEGTTKKADEPPSTGGGLYSTLSDLQVFGQMMLDKGSYNGVRIIGRKTAEAMTRNHLSNVPAYYWATDFKEINYGLGFSLLTDNLVTPGTYNHEGSGRSMLFVDPSESFAAALFVPTTLPWVPESVLNVRSIIWSGIV